MQLKYLLLHLCLCFSLLVACGFGSSYPIYVTFDDLINLDKDSPVLEQGVQIGIVKEVNVHTAHLQIDADIRIPIGSQFELISNEFLDTQILEVHFSKETTFLAPNAQVQGDIFR